jgi:alkylation response protein AidB-like acyl-CoA dehydrogenase
MDFSFTSDQQDLRELAAKILGDATTLERVKKVAADDDGFDRELWSALADAGLIGISLPESAGGAGLGFLETCIVLEEVGRTAAPVPALAVMGLAAPALVEFGATDALDGVAAGTRIVTAALTEAVGDSTSPATTASADGKLTGEKVCVPAGLLADRIIVSARDGLYLVDPSASGVSVDREDTMLGAPMARLVLRDAPSTKLAGPEGLTWLLERAQTAMAVTMSGAAATALDLTSTYVKERKQFGRAIGTFQAVSQRAADTYINKEAIKLTSWQAAWRLDTGMPATTQVATAKYWASQGGQDVLLAAHHLHGGVGVDRDYPLYRYFLLAKQMELDLGSETPTLMRLGAVIAETPAS